MSAVLRAVSNVLIGEIRASQPPVDRTRESDDSRTPIDFRAWPVQGLPAIFEVSS